MRNSPDDSKTTRKVNLTAVILFLLGLSSIGSSNTLTAGLEPNNFNVIWLVLALIYLVTAFFVWKRNSVIACLVGLIAFLLSSVYSLYLSYTNFETASQLMGATTFTIVTILNIGFFGLIGFFLWGGYQALKQGKS